jgi:hypothetical protein
MILTASSRRGFILAGEPACADRGLPGDHAGNRGPIADIAEAFSISVRPSATTYLATNTDGREGRLTVRKD